MKFEIMNLTDKCFLDADNFKCACVVTAILGGGFYGLQEVDGDKSMPPINFAKGWFLDTFNQTIEEAIKEADNDEMIKILRSVKLAYKEPSSLNDIVGNAKRLADLIEKRKG